MSILNESASTRRHLADARFHLASLRADPAAQHLVAPTEKAMAELKAKQDASDQAAENALEHHARLVRGDYDLDTALRDAENALLGKVDKKRDAPAYRTCFPDGLSPLVALRGEAAESAIRQLVITLGSQAPDLAKQFGDRLNQLAKVAASEDKAWTDAQNAEAQAHANELVARAQLVRQLRKNRGSLIALYPNEPARVRTYYRDHSHGTGAAAEQSDGQTAAATAASAVN